MTAVLPGTRIRVGIADDAEELRALLRLALERDDRFVVVGEAGDGEAAVELVAEAGVDVLILDLLMPGTDGFSALERLRREAPATRVLVLSGLDDAAVRQRVLELGAAAITSKRAPVGDVLERVARLAAEPRPPAARHQPATAEPEPRGTSRSREGRSRRQAITVLAATLAFVVGAVATLALTAAWQREAQVEREQRLQAKADRLERLVDDELTTFAGVLGGVRALFAASGGAVTEAEFGTFVRTLDVVGRDPALRAVGYIAHVPADEVDAFVAAVRASGRPDFAVRGSRGGDAVMPVLYREPEGESATYGTDLAGDPARLAALTRSRDTDRPAVTAPLQLFQDAATLGSDAPTAFAIYTPIYRPAVPIGTLAERRAAIQGWVTTTFRAQELLDRVLRSEPIDATIELHAAAEPGADSLVARADPAGGAALGREVAVVPLDVAGRRWSLRIQPIAVRGLRTEQAALTVLLAGLLLSLGLATVVLRLGRQKDEAMAFADEASREVQESRERLRLVAAHAPVGLALLRLDGSWLELNPAMCTLLGRSEDEVRTADPADLVHPDDREQAEALARRLLAGELEEYTHEQRYLRPDGSEVWAAVASTPVRDADGSARFRLLLAEDITDRRRTDAALADVRRALEQRNDDLEDLNAALARSNTDLQDFAYTASHDLSEPLRVINGFVEMLEQDLGDAATPDVAESLAFIVRNVGRMQTLIDDLLAYSRTGTQELRLERVELSAVLDEVRELLGGRIVETGARVEGVDLPVVRGDATALRQLLQNLVGNGLKFVPPERTPTVVVRAREAGDRWEILVEDNGIGIAPEHRQRVFTMFHRLHGRSEYEGTGIGLAICKRIVERHGGRIRIEDRADGEPGAVFVVDLPAATTTGG